MKIIPIIASILLFSCINSEKAEVTEVIEDSLDTGILDDTLNDDTIIYVNLAPNPPSTPLPVNDGKSDDFINTTLTWVATDPDIEDTLSFLVKWGTENPPMGYTSGTLHDTVFIIDTLLPGTEYFWQVFSSDGDTTIAGPVWTFKTPNPPLLNLKFHHLAGQDTLKFNEMLYTNLAGNNFSVTNLQYYISDIVIVKDDGTEFFKFDDIIYVDANEDSTHSVFLKGGLPGHWHSLQFTFGLSPANNVRESLPDIAENINMRWPEFMGGGYHFMKVEGRYLNSNGELSGQATHIGSDTTANYHFGVTGSAPVNSNLSNNTVLEINITMDVLEWFQGPHTYDFNDFQETMGNSDAQLLLYENGQAQNGAGGVFSTEVGEFRIIEE